MVHKSYLGLGLLLHDELLQLRAGLVLSFGSHRCRFKEDVADALFDKAYATSAELSTTNN
jgi:hypothetical protein